MTNPLQRLGWKASVDVAEFDALRLDSSLPALSGALKLEAKGDLETASISGKLDGLYADLGRFESLFGVKRLANNIIQIDRLNLKLPDTGTLLDASGRWMPGDDGGSVKLALNWKKLRWPLQDKPLFSSASGKGTLEGGAQSYRFNLTSDSPWPELIPSSWQVQAEGNLQGMDIQSLSITTKDGGVKTTGRVNWSPALSWQVEVDASGIDPAIIQPEWPGRLSSQFSSEGRLDNDLWFASAKIRELSGTLRGYPLSLSSDLSWQGDRLDIRQLNLLSGGSRLALAGQAGDRLKLDWSLDSSNLAELYPQATGQIQAKGTLSGPAQTPQIVATFNGKALQLADYQLGSIMGDIDVDMKEWHKAEFNLAARSLRIKDRSIESIDIQAEKQRLVAMVVSAELSAQIELKGEAHAKGWRGSVQRADIQAGRFSDWHLQGPASLRVDQQRVELGRLCWLNLQQAELCASVEGEDNRWQSSLQLDRLPLMQFREWLPPDMKLDGAANASVELQLDQRQRLRGQAHVVLPSASIHYPLLDGELEQWEYRDGRVDIELNDQGLEARSEIAMSNGDHLHSELKLPGFNALEIDTKNNPVQASAILRVADLSLIEALIPEINKLKGELEMNLAAIGTLASPRLTMDAGLQNASFKIPRLGLSIERISLIGRSEDFERLNFQLDAESGKGTLKVTGQTELDHKAGWPTQVSIQGRDFEVSRIPDARVQVSPDLQIRLVKRSIDIGGSVHIPFADLQPKDTSSAVRVSSDAVIVGEEQTIAEEKWLITTHVRLTLGERVNFFGFGFEGRLGGSLLLEDEPGQFTKATGEINIPEGRYRAYGQRLDIERGRLLYTGGPITNPGLDVRAVRRINEVTAGIAVKGSLSQPQLDLFSTPAMGQTDALSYLLTGRPIEGSSGEDGAIMAKAALALGLSGGDRIVRNLRDRFGLDEMRVESDDTGDQASLVIGRYLSPRLYVSYGVGLIESVNTLSVRYKISDKWQLKAESGETQGADILYTFER